MLCFDIMCRNRFLLTLRSHIVQMLLIDFHYFEEKYTFSILFFLFYSILELQILRRISTIENEEI